MILENRCSTLNVSISIFVYQIILIISLTPILSRNISMQNYVILLAIWGATIFIAKPSFFFRPTKSSKLTALWIIYLIITRIIGLGDDAIGNLFRYISFWFMLIGAEFIMSLDNINLNKRIERLIHVVLTLNIVANIIEMHKTPNISKYITGGVISGNDSFVGTYEFAFIVGLFGVVNLWKSKQRGRKNILRFFNYAIFLLSFYMVYLSSSMIALMSIIISIIVMFLIRATYLEKNKWILIFLVIIIILLSLVLFNQKMYFWLFDKFLSMDNVLIQERAISILNAVFGRGEESFSGRIPLYKDSIATFIGNPIVGIGMTHTNYQGIVSLHSQVLDDMAYFGIIGVIFHSSIIKSYYYSYIKPNLFIERDFLYSFFTAIFIFSLFNPIMSGAAGIMYFQTVPLVISVSKSKDLG